MIAGHLTKADEKALLRKIIADCPDGYVRDILADMAIEIENAIDSDFGFVMLAQRRRESEEHRAEMLKASAALALLKTQVREKEEDSRRLDNGLRELRTMIKQFAKI